ncbi:MAG: hypothetical protein WD690_10150 [Vicinamibacterales bacterium]
MSEVFFTDRDLGLTFPSTLRGAGLAVERHADHFPPDCPDERWLDEVAARGWVAITHDARIRYKPNELAAVVRHRVTLLVVVGKAPHLELARSFVNTVAQIRSTNTITSKEAGETLADSGSLFLKLMKELGSKADVQEGFAADWNVVAAWLGCHGRDLTDADYEKFGLVFRSYLARGVAPSVPLEVLFKEFAEMAKREKWQLVPVPPELVPVFKRLLASDKDIDEKRANDALRFAAALAPRPTPGQPASSSPDVPLSGFLLLPRSSCY